ncbi:hypothetical protein GH714_021756 [Hevea brasiliensis]|uniref:Uncharacterized protein n=1 Tax=Hevea brasiliensis TaxID=3981 RepID=A0A6A6K6V9_HEVBR|nr:hypothetical protein GH714_021756 [Hevea brasiliensis]
MNGSGTISGMESTAVESESIGETRPGERILPTKFNPDLEVLRARRMTRREAAPGEFPRLGRGFRGAEWTMD